MNYNTTNERAKWERPSLLASLRAVIPRRKLQFHEALRIAELQANRLLALSGITNGPLPDDILLHLPRLRIEYRDLLTSGLSYWDGQAWIICLNTFEPETRQRFTLMHEYKHIIDHGRSELIYTGSTRQTAEEQAEQVADYFAGCALMPKRLVKRAWGEGTQRPRDLADLFDVSPLAMRVRLSQLGLTEPRRRCVPPRRSAQQIVVPTPRNSYRRSTAERWPTRTAQMEAAA